MPRLNRLCCLPLLLLAPALALAQSADPRAPVSTEVHKCVRAGEVFYTNGACPAGTAEARLGQVAPVARQPVMRAEPLPVRPAEAAPMRVERMAPEPAQPRQAAAEPVFQSSLKTVRASDLVPPPSRAPEPESPGEAGGQGFRPLSSFPRLPEAGSPSESRGVRMADEPAVVETPVRAPTRYVAAPMADARASNSATCGFVQAELQRLATEEPAAATDDARARIAGHQKRLRERQAQLRC
jgi:hypothetical protein